VFLYPSSLHTRGFVENHSADKTPQK